MCRCLNKCQTFPNLSTQITATVIAIVVVVCVRVLSFVVAGRGGHCHRGR